MNSEVLRTFLEVNRTRHFGRAAEILHVTPAAVSARIRLLEDALEVRLFHRARNNLQLTLAGTRLVPTAEAIVNAWNRALLETTAEDESKTLVVLGCLPSLSEILTAAWLERIYRDDPPLLKIELLNSAALIPRVRDESISVGLLYEPPQTPDLIIERLVDVELVLVSSTPDLGISDRLPRYVFVDWGTSFAIEHDARVAHAASPVLRVDTPALALRFLQRLGGTAYLARPMIEHDLATGRLHPVAGAPVLIRPANLVVSARSAMSESTRTVITQLKASVK